MTTSPRSHGRARSTPASFGAAVSGPSARGLQARAPALRPELLLPAATPLAPQLARENALFRTASDQLPLPPGAASVSHSPAPTPKPTTAQHRGLPTSPRRGPVAVAPPRPPLPTVDDVRVSVQAVASPSPPRSPAGGGLAALYASLLRGEVPSRSLVRSVSPVPAGFDFDQGSLDAVQCLGYIERLDATHHLLAEYGALRPTPWPYPQHHPRQPSFAPRKATCGKAAPSDKLRDAARQTARDLEHVTSRDTWRRVLQRAQVLSRRTPRYFEADFRAIENVLQDLTASRRVPVTNPLQVRRGKKAAQLIFTLATLGRPEAAARALGHYAAFADDELKSPQTAAPSYEAHLLSGSELNTWLATCPLACLSRLDLWHPGLRATVDAHTLSLFFSRLQPNLVGWFTAERALFAAARRGRLPDGAWTRAFVAAVTAGRGVAQAEAERYAANLLRKGLLVRTARRDEPWPHLPLTIGLGSEGPVAAQAKRSHGYDVATRHPEMFTAADLLQLAAEGEAAGEARQLLKVVQAAPERFADPFLGVPLLRVLLRANDTAACCMTFVHLRLRTDDELDPQIVRELFAAAARENAWPLLAHMLSFLDARGLAYHTHVTEALAEVRADYARSLLRAGHFEVEESEERALAPLVSPAAVLAAWRRGDAPFAPTQTSTLASRPAPETRGRRAETTFHGLGGLTSRLTR